METSHNRGQRQWSLHPLMLKSTLLPNQAVMILEMICWVKNRMRFRGRMMEKKMVGL